MTAAIVVSVFHPAADGSAFDAWTAELIACAQAADGFRSGRASLHTSRQLDWAVAITFEDEDLLHAWLDSTERAGSLRNGSDRGYRLRTTDIVMVDGKPAPTGVGAFRQVVAEGKEDEFVAAQRGLNEASAEYPGFEGAGLFPPVAGDEWLSMVRYRTAEQLGVWSDSAERASALAPMRRALTTEFAPLTSTTPFATTVRIENGRTLMTPNWKSAMMVLLVLYPTVMLLSRFVGPVFDGWGAQPWLALWLSQVLSISLMQWWLMPWATRPFTRWLDPVDGRGTRISVLGAVVVLAGYAVTLALFSTVHWLQYWDYNT
ncbi:antibiotic biosynthesis monooxygenase [Mycobacterium sp. MS1601]|uniref:antibiotic biosynthesis monooxygenase n=1 Tax=Mycobacterium sp. MS1601 TaxID=1936029 RepID=UPI0009793574|nr:antibiotic biosynthesis monooxygenase [Mycobacterium sp. MS1601]AQA03735.1 antibiotic biosynthesis monooxygenase [Mycobacterium sp. MS1601]